MALKSDTMSMLKLLEVTVDTHRPFNGILYFMAGIFQASQVPECDGNVYSAKWLLAAINFLTPQ